METPRETAGVTTRLLLAYVRRRAGESGVSRVLASSGVQHALAQLEDERFWCSYEDKIALFRAAGELLDDPLIGRHVGEALLEEQVGTALRLLIGSLGSPQQVLRSISRANAKFTSSGTMTTVATTSCSGVISYRVHPSKQLDRTDCDYAQGVLSQVSVLFGLPPATVHHPTCQLAGDDECRYELSWTPMRLRDRFTRRPRTTVSPYETDALREQLVDLQLTVADLVSTPDLDELLQRIADRAGASVRGQRYLLAVQLDGEPAPRVHAEGFARADAVALGAALLTGAPDGTPARETRLVTQVRSARCHYGWLAAEMVGGQGFLPAEQQQLDAFGRLAAAALDAATSLEQARRRGETAEVLLRLGHELAREHDEVGVAQQVCRAVPTVLGAARSLVLSWDADAGLLRTTALHGFGEDATRASRLTLEHEDGTDEVAAMRRAPMQRWLTERDDLPGGLTMAEWHASVMATAPLVVRGRLAAVLVAIWDEERPPRASRDQLLARLASLGDQATTALSAVRALTEARYRASHDALTGLANRVLFTERVEQALTDARRTGVRPVVCFIDLDGFKQVNDVHGHAVGDQLLVQVGARVLGALRETDAAARLSGDEFGVLLRGVTELADAEVVAAKLVDTLGRPFRVDAEELHISASVGVARAPAAGTDPDRLLNAADDAMYRAKLERGTYRLSAAVTSGSTCV